MLYRLTPPRSVTWCDISGAMVMEAAARHPEVDLDNLTWEPTEDREFSNNLLRLALRYGRATRTGIAMDAVHAADLGRAEEIMLSQYRAQEAQNALRASGSGSLMEQLVPGWAEQGETLDREIARGMQNAARQAEEDLEEKLAAPAQPDLVEHWARLGGPAPAEV